MIRTFLKEDKTVIDIDDHRLRHTISELNQNLFDFYADFIAENKYTECFDTRKCVDILGKSNTIVLENASNINKDILDFSIWLSKIGIKSNIRQFVNLNNDQGKWNELEYLFINNKINNVVIDSKLYDDNQIHKFVKILNRSLNKVCVFISSYDNLLNTLNSMESDDLINAVNNYNVYDIFLNDRYVYKVSHNKEKGFFYVNKYYLNEYSF